MVRALGIKNEAVVTVHGGDGAVLTQSPKCQPLEGCSVGNRVCIDHHEISYDRLRLARGHPHLEAKPAGGGIGRGYPALGAALRDHDEGLVSRHGFLAMPTYSIRREIREVD